MLMLIAGDMYKLIQDRKGQYFKEEVNNKLLLILVLNLYSQYL